MSEARKFDVASTTSPLTQTTTNVYASSCRLNGVYINTALSAHTIDVIDFNESASPQTTRTIATIPASATAGTFYEFPGIRVQHSLRTVANAAATGDITVMFSPGVPSNR